MGLIPTLNAPTTGDPRVPAPLVANDNAIRTVVNGQLDTNNISPTAGILGSQLSASAAIAGTQLSASAAIADTQLGSPLSATYKTIRVASVYFGGGTTATYWVEPNFAIGTGAATTSTTPPQLWRFASGDYSVGGRTTKFRMVMNVVVGGTSPSTVTLTAGLYPVTISGGNYTLGTVVTGSTAASSGLSTNNVFSFNSGDFAASALTDPANYTMGVVVGSITVPAGIAVTCELQQRHT